MMKKPIATLAALAMSALMLSGCTGSGGDAAPPQEVIRVGSKDFTEQLILGQIAILALEANGISTLDRTNIAGTENVRAALDSAEIDLYWEYTGTAWIMLMGQELIPGETPTQLFQRVREADAHNGIVWLDYAPLNNTYAIAITAEKSGAYGIRTLSDLAEHKRTTGQRIRLAAEHEFLVRADGLPGMIETFNFPDFEINAMMTGLVYSTLADGLVDASVVFATDGRILYHNFVVLQDDRYFFPSYNPAPSIRTDALERFPQITEILAPVAAQLTDDIAQHLNFLVDSGQMEPDEAAAYWLSTHFSGW